MKLKDLEIGVDYARRVDSVVTERVRVLAIEHHEQTGEYGTGKPARLVRVLLVLNDGTAYAHRREVLVRPNALRPWAEYEAERAAEAADTEATYARIDRINEALTAAGMRPAAMWDSETEAIRATLRLDDLERLYVILRSADSTREGES